MLSAVSTNWETAAVFLTAYARGTSALSLRVISDSAEGGALLEFITNIREASHRLYSFLGYLMDEAWFEGALDALDRWRDDILSSPQ
jgi:nucleoside phosphorylase